MSMMRNLVTSLVIYEQVETTISKGKELSSYFEHILVRSKSADLNAVRYLNSVLFDKKACKKVIDELVPRYKNRNSGFSRVLKIKNRIGDNATIVKVELMDKKIFVDEEKKNESVAKATVSKTEAATSAKDKIKVDK